jgi:hypothetical protein
MGTGELKMALDKFINNVRTKVAEKYNLKTDAEIDAFFLGMEESAKDNQEILEKRDKMLRDTVEELCEAKLLLKAAVEDFSYCNGIYEFCYYNIGCGVCADCNNTPCNEFKWRYTDEALKLIND